MNININIALRQHWEDMKNKLIPGTNITLIKGEEERVEWGQLTFSWLEDTTTNEIFSLRLHTTDKKIVLINEKQPWMIKTIHN